MKIVTVKESNSVFYTTDDDDAKIVEINGMVSTPAGMYAGMTLDDVAIYENVTLPPNWQAGRYTFDGTTWAEIAGWVDPRLAEIARLEEEIARLKAE